MSSGIFVKDVFAVEVRRSDSHSVLSVCDIVPWKIIRLGKYQNSREYLAALKDRGLVVGRIAKEAIEKISVSGSVIDIATVRVSAETLGLADNATLGEICDFALASGFKLCAQEVALALREKYMDQPEGEILWVATKTITVSKRDFGVLCVGHDQKGQWLSLGCGSGCSWGRLRRVALNPEIQTRIIPMGVCECPWSRGPITAIFEMNSL